MRTAFVLTCGAGVLSAAVWAGAPSSGSTQGVKPGAVAAAKATVAAARRPITRFTGPTTSPGPIPKGKKIAIIDIVPAPFINNLHAGDVAAARAVGWTARAYNAKGTPQGIQQAMASALASKPDAMILNADPVAFMQPQLKQAKAQGIHVVALTPGLPRGKPASAWNVVNTIDYPRVQLGSALASWVIQDSPTGAEVIMLSSPEFQSFNDIAGIFAKRIKSAGSAFRIVATLASPVSDLAGAQTGISRLAGPMRKYPNAKYFYTLSESWFPLFLQATQAADRPDVTALGTDGDLSTPLVKQGKKLVFMGTDSKALGWYAVDALIRAFNNKPQVHYNVPLRLIDAVNAKSINSPGVSYSYDYAGKWKALWGVK